MSKGKIVGAGAYLGGIIAAGRLARRGGSVTVAKKNIRSGGRYSQPTFPPRLDCPHCTARPVQITGCELSVIPLSNRIADAISLERMTGCIQ